MEAITSAADLVYSQGPPAKVRITVFVPGGVQEVNITNRTVSFKVRYTTGLTGVFAVSRARLNGTIPTDRGTYWLGIRAVDHVDYDIDIQKV